jgi:undecaprenyl-diphosphatase
MTSFIIYVLLGALQGVFEWIPISSEGVVALAAQYFRVGINPVDFALFLHIGTLAAALAFYWRDWTNVLSLKDLRLVKFLTITTIISLPVGFLIYKTITLVTLGVGLLLLTGVGLLFTAYFTSKKISLNLNQTSLAVLSAVLQGIAVIPGFSRSGSTIFGLSLGSLKPQEILRLSYLMSVPAVAASTGYLILFKAHGLTFSIWPAIVSSFIVGLLSLQALTKFAQKINFSKFALAFALLCFLGVLLELIG